MEISRTNSYLNEVCLKCPICYENFSNLHKPIIIPCGHTICIFCVDNLKKLSEEEADEEEYKFDIDEEYDVSLDSDEDSQQDDGTEDDGNDEEEESESEEEDRESEETDRNEIETEEITPPSKIIVDYTKNEVNNKPIVMDDKKSGSGNNNVKIKLKCSICRKKMKILNSDIILNKNIINIINEMEKEKLKLGELDAKEINKEKYIFCKMCRFADSETNHLTNPPYSDHKKHFIYLNNERFVEMKFNMKNRNEDIFKYNESVINPIVILIEKLLSSDYFELKNCLLNYITINSKASSLRHKSFKKLMKLYLKFSEIVNSEQEDKEMSSAIYKKAELCLESAENLMNKYFKIVESFKNNLLRYIEENDIKNSEKIRPLQQIIENSFKDKTDKILKGGIIESTCNKLIMSERKYALNVDLGESVLSIYDLRVGTELKLKFENILSRFVEEKKDTSIVEKLSTQNVEINDNGTLLFLIGKKDFNSKKFRIFDLVKRELYDKANFPEKINTVDRIFYQDKLYVLGGSTLEDPYIHRCYYYDIDSDWWEELPSLSVKRTWKSIAVCNNKLYVFGGIPDQSNLFSKSFIFEVLDLEKIADIDNFKWENFEIKGFDSCPQYFIYGFITPSLLFLAGGEEFSSYQENLHGYLIDNDPGKREIIEKVKIKQTVYNNNNTCSNYRGFIVGSQLGDQYFSYFDVRSNFKKLKTTLY